MAVVEKSASRGAGYGVSLLVAGTFFMENLDSTVITPAIPHMAADFGVPPIDLNTGVSAYLLTLGVFIPASGWVADRFGSRRVFTSAILLFTLASLLCGLARTLDQFIVVRVLQGIGGALMVPVGRLVVLRVTPKDRLIHAIAVLTWPALVAFILGPPLGGLIADYSNWRWIFYLNLPLGLAAFALSCLFVPNESGPERQPFDWPGFVLTGGALFCLLFTADLLGRPEIEWLKASLFAVAGIGLMTVDVRHLLRAPTPMISLRALDIATFRVAIAGGSLFRMGISAVPFLIPLMFQIGLGYSASSAGLVLMAVFAGNLIVKPATTPIMRRYGFRTVLIVNGLLNVLLIAACATFSVNTPLAVVCLILFAGGMSRSTQFTALNSIAYSDVPQAEMSAANTLFSAAFQLSMGLGIAVAAVGWRLGGSLTGVFGTDPAMPFRVAVLILAGVALVGLWDSLKLAPNAGDQVSKGAKAG
jgi:EmrB/QacA subfamily drug resistance transporter